MACDQRLLEVPYLSPCPPPPGVSPPYPPHESPSQVPSPNPLVHRADQSPPTSHVGSLHIARCAAVDPPGAPEGGPHPVDDSARIEPCGAVEDEEIIHRDLLTLDDFDHLGEGGRRGGGGL